MELTNASVTSPPLRQVPAPPWCRPHPTNGWSASRWVTSIGGRSVPINGIRSGELPWAGLDFNPQVDGLDVPGEAGLNVKSAVVSPGSHDADQSSSTPKPTSRPSRLRPSPSAFSIIASERSTVRHRGVLRRFWRAPPHPFHVHGLAASSFRAGKKNTDLHIARALNHQSASCGCLSWLESMALSTSLSGCLGCRQQAGQR